MVYSPSFRKGTGPGAFDCRKYTQFTPHIAFFSTLEVVYKRTGPGEAIDGGPKFDLEQFNEDFFDRLRWRTIAVGKRGIYVGVMFFQGFSLDQRGKKQEGLNAFDGHPMHAANNVNGIDGDPDGSGTYSK